MMQMNGDFSSHKNSLINVMNRFIAATNNMDETIMVPSLLRDVPVEEQESPAPLVDRNHNDVECVLPSKMKDMYEHYLLLKSIKNDMEWGLLKREVSSGTSFLEMAVKQQEEQQQMKGEAGATNEEASDLESQFHFHLHGLFRVLSKLTLQADHVTNRYKREIGGGSFIR